MLSPQCHLKKLVQVESEFDISRFFPSKGQAACGFRYAGPPPVLLVNRDFLLTSCFRVRNGHSILTRRDECFLP